MSDAVSTDRDPPKQQMAHDSMTQTLRLQAEASWSLEKLLMDRYGLEDCRVMDDGCGTGEFSSRLADLGYGVWFLPSVSAIYPTGREDLEL
jgi:2-polyprenyl-3-methyl-5-hydroxy-6-metoxy-1,4-benzoquinol methylase